MIEGIIYGTLLMVAFLFGLKVGIGLHKGKDIELNPVKAVTNVIQDTKEFVRETVEQEKTRQAEEYKQQGLENIINYDGTKESQK